MFSKEGEGNSVCSTLLRCHSLLLLPLLWSDDTLYWSNCSILLFIHSRPLVFVEINHIEKQIKKGSKHRSARHFEQDVAEVVWNILWKPAVMGGVRGGAQNKTQSDTL